MGWLSSVKDKRLWDAVMFDKDKFIKTDISRPVGNESFPHCLDTYHSIPVRNKNTSAPTSSFIYQEPGDRDQLDARTMREPMNGSPF